MKSIFKRSVELNMKIEKFLNIISDSLSLLDKIIQLHLKEEDVLYSETLERIIELETQADELESDIKQSLYKYMLLPDTRADVLSIIKSLDNIIDNIEEMSKEFHIQKPKFPDELNEEIINLTKNSCDAAENVLLATRSFFSDVHLISSHINKVKFFEHEVDLLEDHVNYRIFNEGIVESLAEKLQLKGFVTQLASISDEAEVISEKLAIFAIKREI